MIKGKNNEYMLSSGKKYSILQIVNIFNFKHRFIPSRPGDRTDSTILNNNAKIMLGFKAKKNIKTYIKEFINKY